MGLEPLTWSGSAYTLSIQRHPRVFWGFATICDVNRPQLRKFLPESAGHHITLVYEMAQGAKGYFDTYGNWQIFSARLCDQYCDYYVMQRYQPGNVFADYGNRGSGSYSAQELARQTPGYIGPRWWSLYH